MAQNRHYSPRIGRFLVCALYHEARERQVPMTRLVDSLLRESLAGSPGWQKAEEDRPPGEKTSQDRPGG